MNLKEKNIKTFDRIAEVYDKGIIKKWSLLTQKNAIDSLRIKRNAKILDAGCGTGNLLSILSEKDKSFVLYGIDVSAKMLKAAKAKLKGRAKLRIMPVEKLKDKKKFDYIFSVDAFHHYYDQDKAMKNLFLALKKGGSLIVVDIDFGFVFNAIFHAIEPGNNKIIPHVDMISLFQSRKFHSTRQKKIWYFTFMTVGEKVDL